MESNVRPVVYLSLSACLLSSMACSSAPDSRLATVAKDYDDTRRSLDAEEVVVDKSFSTEVKVDIGRATFKRLKYDSDAAPTGPAKMSYRGVDVTVGDPAPKELCGTSPVEECFLEQDGKLVGAKVAGHGGCGIDENGYITAAAALLTAAGVEESLARTMAGNPARAPGGHGTPSNELTVTMTTRRGWTVESTTSHDSEGWPMECVVKATAPIPPPGAADEATGGAAPLPQGVSFEERELCWIERSAKDGGVKSYTPVSCDSAEREKESVRKSLKRATERKEPEIALPKADKIASLTSKLVASARGNEAGAGFDPQACVKDTEAVLRELLSQDERDEVCDDLKGEELALQIEKLIVTEQLEAVPEDQRAATKEAAIQAMQGSQDILKVLRAASSADCGLTAHKLDSSKRLLELKAHRSAIEICYDIN